MNSIFNSLAPKTYFAFRADVTQNSPLTRTMNCEEKSLNCFQQFLRYLGFYKDTQLNYCTNYIIHQALHSDILTFSDDRAQQAAARIFEKSLNRGQLPINDQNHFRVSLLQFEFSPEKTYLSKIVFTMHKNRYQVTRGENIDHPVTTRCDTEGKPLAPIEYEASRPENEGSLIGRKLFAIFP